MKIRFNADTRERYDYVLTDAGRLKRLGNRRRPLHWAGMWLAVWRVRLARFLRRRAAIRSVTITSAPGNFPAGEELDVRQE